MRKAEEDILTDEVLQCLEERGLVIRGKLQANSKQNSKFLIARGNNDGPLAVLKIQRHKSPQTYGELRHWSKLDHMNCVKLLDTFSIGSQVAFLYEYCALGRLEAYITQNKIALSDDCLQSMFRTWIKQLLQALAYLQQQGLYHQFLRPQVLWLDENKNLKLSGFGALRTNRAHLQPFVSEKYLPPDCLLTKKKNTDFAKLHTWSAGAVLLELFADSYIGGPDFNPGNRSRQRRNILSNVEQLRTVNGLSEDIRNVFAVMLISDVNCRPTVNVVLQFIHSWKEGMPEMSAEETVTVASQPCVHKYTNTSESLVENNEAIAMCEREYLDDADYSI